MRILLIINGTDFGGTETVVAQIALRLDQRGHDVRVLSIKPPGRIGHRLMEQGIAVSTVGMDETVNLLNMMSATLKLRRRFRAEPLDVISSFMPRANIMSRIANRFSGRRKAHFSREESTDFNRSRLVCLMNRYTARWTDAILAVSPAVREVLISRDRVPADKVQLLANAVDIDFLDSLPRSDVRRQLNLEPRQMIFCSVGRLIPDKGYVYLIQAMARMSHRGEGVHLVLVGEGPEEERIRTEVRNQGLAKQVHLLGFRDDAVGILKDVDAFVLSSLEEGVPLVLLESMACTLPIIATRVGGVPDLVAHGVTGLLVPPQEVWRDGMGASSKMRADDDIRRPTDADGVAALAQAMDRFVEEPELLRTLGSNGRARLESVFGIDRVVTRLEALYRLGTTDSERIGLPAPDSLAGDQGTGGAEAPLEEDAEA